MKKILIAVTIVALFIPAACSKNNDGGNSGAPISSDAQAKLLFSYINAMWNSRLKPVLSKKGQTYTNFVLVDSAGQKVIVNGSYSASNFSGSSGSTSSTMADVTISFQQYKADGLSINGTLIFFDSYNSRTDCGASGCATSTHKSISYKTTDTTAAAAVAVSYNNGGSAISDNIGLSANKQFSTFAVRMKNKKGQNFSFSF